MKKTIIIVFIAVLSVAAICLGVLIAVTPDPVEPVPVDPHTPNSLIATLGIERPATNQERLIAIKTYQGGIDTDDLIKIAEFGGLQYHELDPNSNDYLLVIPFEINGKMSVYGLGYDTASETYIANQPPVFQCNKGEALPDNYALLLRYSRPTIPEYQIDLVQTDNVAAYQISNVEKDKFGKYTTVGVLQLVKEYIEGDTNPETESPGAPIKLDVEEE